MNDSTPPLDEFASTFVKFMEAMTEAAHRPESPLVSRLREHLGAQPGDLPITAVQFGAAERPNHQTS